MKSSSRNFWSPFPGVMAVILLVLAAATAGWAQKDMGSIVGIVKDGTGAVVVDAKVTVTDVDRGTALHTTTNSSGEYVAGPLRIGQYTVAVEKTGFKRAVAGPVPLNVQDRIAVDVTLQVGTISETMTVTTTRPQLETETSELGEVVGSHTATTLPLNGRNFAQLAQLAVGVAPSEPGSRVETSWGFSSNGARALQNNFLLDGVDNNANLGDVLNASAYVIQPSVDAIGEFKVETNSYSSEFGRGNGAIMNAVIKSGTNGLHGDLYEFIRNDKLDGRNAFDFFGRQPYQQNQFGATLGGPIKKDRTFFFVDYEGLRIRQSLPQLLLIPTPAQLSGDFSSFLTTQLVTTPTGATVLDCNSKPTYWGEMFNPRQTIASTLNANGFCGFPVGVDSNLNPTNIFPTTGDSAISQTAAKVAALFPAPSPNINIGGNNYLVDPKKSLEQNNFDVRVDHRFSDRDNFFARFSYEDQPIFTPGPFTGFLDGGGFTAGNQDNAYRSAAISELHTFSTNLLNEFRLGYNRINSHRSPPNAGTDVSGQLGLKGVPYYPGIGGLPSICFVNYACIGSSDFLPAIEKQNSFVLNENLIWIRGRHSMKFGTELRKEEFTIFEQNAPRGDMSYGPDFTTNPGDPIDPTTGNFTGGDDIASFLLGVPDSANIASLTGPDYHRNTFAFFAQDDIRVTDRLTLNLGLRYELFMPVTEGRNQQGTFDFRTDTLIVPKGQNVKFNEAIASFLGTPQATGSAGLINPDYKDFAPRFGLAYSLTNRLVLRAGYGIFYGGVENGPFSWPSPGFNPPYFLTQTFGSPCGSPTPPQANVNDPADLCAVGVKFPAGGGAPDTSLMINNFWSQGYPQQSLKDPNNPYLYSIDPDMKTPMMQQWHLGLEQQLPGQTVVELSYAGSHGLRLYGFYNGNQATPSPDPNALTAPRRPFPSVDGTIYTFRSNTISNYDSLQARIEKRASHGLQFEASYTYSHSLDDASSASLGSLNNGDFRDQRYPNMEYGNSDFDVRQHLVVSYAWELPFGKNKAVGGSASGFLNGLIGNWQLAGIVSASTGNWFTVSDPIVNAANNDCGGVVVWNCPRPNVVGNPNAKPTVPGTFFNTGAFSDVNMTPGQYGNEGRNITRGPGYQIWDMSVLKAFPVGEQKRFEFRADLFNVWNHVNPLWGPFGAAGQVEPVAVEIGTPQFGQLQAAKDPRFIQFALKFYF